MRRTQKGTNENESECDGPHAFLLFNNRQDKFSQPRLQAENATQEKVRLRERWKLYDVKTRAVKDQVGHDSQKARKAREGSVDCRDGDSAEHTAVPPAKESEKIPELTLSGVEQQRAEFG
jgi:hypothetical protein